MQAPQGASIQQEKQQAKISKIKLVFLNYLCYSSYIDNVLTKGNNMKTINLTIGNETRAVEVSETKYPCYTAFSVYNLKVTTTHGNQVHEGTAVFLYVEGVEEYNINDAIDIRYAGMRGNGRAKRSDFRYVGF